jgi:hypothetical protein
VYTPRPETPSELCLQIALSVADSATENSNFAAFDIDPMLAPPKGNTVPDDRAYLRGHGLLESSRRGSKALTSTSQTLTVSTLQYLDRRWDVFPKSFPRSIQDPPDSPEVLLSRFRDEICPMLSVTHGQNNMWKTLVLPAVRSSESLYHAISAQSALHISTDNRLRIHGTKLMAQSVRKPRHEIKGGFGISTLATILILAFWAICDEGFRVKKLHIEGAFVVRDMIWSRSLGNESGALLLDSPPLFIFLSDACIYLDVLTRLIFSMTTSRDCRARPGLRYGLPHGLNFQLSVYHPDPWMFCAASLCTRLELVSLWPKHNTLPLSQHAYKLFIS